MLTRWARSRVLVVVTAGLIGLAASTALAATTESHRIRIEVRVLGDDFEQGEPVPFEVLACSNSYAPMRRTVAADDAMWSISGPEVRPVAESHHYRRSQGTERVFWWPRSCRRVAADVWDQTEWNVDQPGWIVDGRGLARPLAQRTGWIVRGPSTPPGRYTLHGTWAGLQSENRAEFAIIP